MWKQKKFIRTSNILSLHKILSDDNFAIYIFMFDKPTDLSLTYKTMRSEILNNAEDLK